MDSVETYNVPRDLAEHIQHALDNVIMIVMTRYEFKFEKFENRVLVLDKYRLLLTTTRVPCKVEQSFSLLSISNLESKAPNKLSFTAEGKHLNFLITDADRLDSLLLRIIEAVSVAFPRVSYEQVIGKFNVEPHSRGFHERLQEMKSRLEKQDMGPCGSFSLAYHFMCDWLNQPYLPDVAWDVDTIYMSNDIRELRLIDFDHLDGRHILPVIAAVEYNPWFTSISTEGVKLLPEVISAVPNVMRRNFTIAELHLGNSGIRSDFVQRLSTSLISNPDTALVYLDLSNNPIEDKGVAYLSTAIAKLPNGLVHLNLSQTGITARGINKLTEALCANQCIPSTLEVLDLSCNSLRGEEVTNLFNFLAQPNSMTDLNLMSSECVLDAIFGALLRGCCQKMKRLNLSQNPFHPRKSSKVQASCKQFLGSALSLQSVNLSNCRLSGEAVKSVLLGLGSNPSSTDIELNISSNNLSQDVANLELCLSQISSITSLDLSDNNLDISLLSLVKQITKNGALKKIGLGRNIATTKTSKRNEQILEFLSEMINDDNSKLESLSLAGSKLRGLLTCFINALGTNTTLKEIDISGNLMGDTGARMLAKALQINTSLHTVYLDQNCITAQGFMDIAKALEKNFTLKKMPIPLSDVAVAMKMNPSGTETALKRIESILQRNHSPRKFATEQCYRLQHSLLMGTLQQLMDKAIVEVQSVASKLEEMNVDREEVLEDLTEGHCLVKDASNSKQIMMRFQMIAEKSESESGALYELLKDTTDRLQNAIEEELKKNIIDMLECSSDQCPTLLDNKDLHDEVASRCKEKAQIPKEYIHSLVVDQLGADVFNKVGEVNLSVATLMSNLLIEKVHSALILSHRKLTDHLHEQKKLTNSENKDKTDESEKRASLLRRKNTDGDVDYLDPNIISATKRKSFYSCRVRPQSRVVCCQTETLTGTGTTDHPPIGQILAGSMADTMNNQEAGHDSANEEDLKVDGNSSPIPKPRRKRVSMAQQHTGNGTGKVSPPLPQLHQKSTSRPEATPEAAPKNVQSAVHEMAEDLFTDSTDVTDGSTSSSPLNSRENTPSHEPHGHKAKKKSIDKSPSLDVPMDTLHLLSHPVKDRPRRPKNRPMTRANVQSRIIVNDDNKEVRDDVEDFFIPVKAPEQKSPTPVVKKDDSKSKKKGWSPFSGKAGEKGGFFSSKKSQPLKSPGASSLKKTLPGATVEVKDEKSEFKEKNASSERLSSHENPPEQDGAKSEDDKDSDEVEEAKPHKPAALRMGIGIGGGALIAEMKAKRASMAPVSAKKSDAEDHPGGRSLLQPTGNSTVGVHPTGVRSVSPGLDEKVKPVPRPRPPPGILPKPKPSPLPAEGKPTIAPVKPVLSRGFSDAVEESDKGPQRNISYNAGVPSDIANTGIKKRLSVREKAAALDKNRNECANIVRRASHSREKSTGGGADGKTLRPKDASTESGGGSDVIGSSESQNNVGVGAKADEDQEVYL